MAFETIRQDWEDMDKKWRTVIIAIAVTGCIIIGIKVARGDSEQPSTADSTKTDMPNAGQDVPKDSSAFHLSVIPSTNRNQGLEDLKTEIESLREEVIKSRGAGAPNQWQPAGATGGAAGTPPAPATSAPTAQVDLKAPGNQNAAGSPSDPNAAGIDLNKPIPGVSFDESTKGGTGEKADRTKSLQKINNGDPMQLDKLRPKQKVWPSEAVSEKMQQTAADPGPVIPVNSALEAIMLSGVNARPSGSISGAAGSINSANNVGAPFVTRIKGDAILPNGWKLNDLGDCFLSGSATAVLSTERAYAVAENLSCIGKAGEIYEGKIQAYALDADGTLGIAGKVVSKQGSLLLQAALTGMASGLGSALSPTAIPGYNQNVQSGSTAGIQYPNGALVAQSAVGQGINTAAGQLSKFYLEYAREIFPVVEVTAGTRVTWVLKESIELKRRMVKGS